MSAVSLLAHVGRAPRAVTSWVAAGLGLYTAAIAITRAVHLPLNDAVEAEGRRPGPAAASRLRHAFEARWVRWHRVRSLLAVGAFACLALASREASVR